MMDAVFLYLLKASLCLFVFSMVYRWLFSGFTHFQWMRFYLLGSVALGMVLPLLQVPAFFSVPFFSSTGISPSSGYFNFDMSFLTAQNTAPSNEAAPNNPPFNLWLVSGYFFLTVYCLGFLYKISVTGRNLFRIRQFIRHHHKVRKGNHYWVYLPQNLPAFSFWHYVFLNPDFHQLSADEQQQIKAHELVHVRQKHTLDLLFFEIAGALFWFNPFMIYLKKTLREVHEYLADAGVAGKGHTEKAYAHLLLKLAVQPRLVPLANSISGKQISRRIRMLTKARSLPVQKLTFSLIFPMAVFLLLLNACMDEAEVKNGIVENENVMQQSDQASMTDGKKIRKIIWEGNSIYDDETLNRTLGLSEGDFYSEEVLNQHLNYNPGGKDVSTLYMDHGYIFFSVDVQEKQVTAEGIDLVFNLFEGNQVKIENIIIKGNQTVPTSEIRTKIPIKEGDVFSRSKLLEAQKNIAAMGYFDPQQVGINPLPDYSHQPEDGMGKMDIEFVVIETNPR